MTGVSLITLMIGSNRSFSANGGGGTFILVVLSVLNRLLSTSSSSNFFLLIDRDELRLSGTEFCNIGICVEPIIKVIKETPVIIPTEKKKVCLHKIVFVFYTYTFVKIIDDCGSFFFLENYPMIH
jgi:hypothetical protein